MLQKPWIERQFPSDIAPDLFHGLIERLRGTPARLEERLAAFNSQMVTKRIAGKWSAQEQAGHLVAVEPLWLGRLDDFAAGLEVLRAADMTNQKTEKADFNAQPLAAVFSEFRALRAKLVACLEALGAADLERTALHPRLRQPMRIPGMTLFVAEHDDHHLARITELLRA